MPPFYSFVVDRQVISGSFYNQRFICVASFLATLLAVNWHLLTYCALLDDLVLKDQ